MPNELLERIVARIDAGGPLTWAEYMEAALYDPEHGFFATGQPVGRDFATSAHVSPVYAALLARLVVRARDHLASPDDFQVVDVGAGDGALAAAIAASLGGTLEPVCVERNPHGRAAIAARGLRAVVRLDEVAPVTGLLIANELFDNLPFHRVRWTDGDPVEVVVDHVAGRLVEREAPLPPGIAPLASEPRPPGTESTVSPASAAMIAEIAAACARACIAIVDYGWVGDEPAEAVRGYREHRPVTDLLAEPGTTDITGPVDFGALARAATAAGLRAAPPLTQRDALIALGYRDVLDDLRRRQAGAEAAGRWTEAVATFGARGDAALLVDRAGLGGFRVLILTTPDVEPLILGTSN